MHPNPAPFDPGALVVEDAREEDREWVLAVWKENEAILGSLNVAHRTFYWHFNRPRTAPTSPERWIVIRPHGFAHFRIRKDTLRNVQEIAVASTAKRRGVGRRLLEAVGNPVILKTNADHEESNAFYRAQGFTLVSRSAGRDGRPLNHYQRWDTECAE